jgi:hypothetical protein|tara:strand:+ start:29 stop:280 length:252 start_codon:yes stop_codon:yes gene_type:complete
MGRFGIDSTVGTPWELQLLGIILVLGIIYYLNTIRWAHIYLDKDGNVVHDKRKFLKKHILEIRKKNQPLQKYKDKGTYIDMNE